MLFLQKTVLWIWRHRLSWSIKINTRDEWFLILLMYKCTSAKITDNFLSQTFPDRKFTQTRSNSGHDPNNDHTQGPHNTADLILQICQSISFGRTWPDTLQGYRVCTHVRGVWGHTPLNGQYIIATLLTGCDNRKVWSSPLSWTLSYDLPLPDCIMWYPMYLIA